MDNVDQKSQEWLDWRTGGIGASDVAALFNDVEVTVNYLNVATGVEGEVVVQGTPYQTAYSLWRQKTGRDNPPNLANNPNVQRGNALEDEAREDAGLEFGKLLVPVCAQHSDHPFIRVSFDAVFPNGDTLEIKAPGERVYAEAKANGPTPYNIWQVIDQMAVSSEAQYGYLYLYRRGEDKLIYRIAREAVAGLIDKLVDRQKAFWHVVESDLAPALDPERDSLDLSGNSTWDARAEDWQIAHAEEQRLKALYETARNERQEVEKEMSVAVGSYASASNGFVRFTRFTRQGSPDYAKLVADRLGTLTDKELALYRRKSTEQVKVTLVTPES